MSRSYRQQYSFIESNLLLEKNFETIFNSFLDELIYLTDSIICAVRLINSEKAPLQFRVRWYKMSVSILYLRKVVK